LREEKKEDKKNNKKKAVKDEIKEMMKWKKKKRNVKGVITNLMGILNIVRNVSVKLWGKNRVDRWKISEKDGIRYFRGDEMRECPICGDLHEDDDFIGNVCTSCSFIMYNM